MRRCWVPVMFAVLLAACAHKHVTRSNSAFQGYAVTQNMQREIQNARDAGDGDIVLRQYRERLTKDPKDLDARLQIAEYLKRTGNMDLALEHYRLAEERFPDNAAVAVLLTKTLRDSKQQSQAIDEAVKFCKNHDDAPPELLSIAGAMLDDAGQFDQAESYYRRAITESPNLSYLHNNLGYNLLQQKRAPEAVKELKRALELDPHSEIATNNLAIALLNAWKTDAEPREALTRWESIGDRATAHNNLASYLIEQQRYKEAHKELDVALKLNPNLAAARRNERLLATLQNGGRGPSEAPVAQHAADPDLVSILKRFTVSSKKSSKKQQEQVHTGSN